MPSGSAQQEIHLLSQLVLGGDATAAVAHVSRLDDQGRAKFFKLAHSHHVIIRGLRALEAGADQTAATDVGGWARQMLSAEQERIANAIEFLDAISSALEKQGCPVTIIKSLDHWPDLGGDLDLYTPASKAAAQTVLQREFQAQAAPRSWGDRLADKCSYRIPGLRATVEMHHGRLGQTGEHRSLARRFWERRVYRQYHNYCLAVPAAEESVIAATLQRMYRHCYVRICDIANTTVLLESGELDYQELQSAAASAGIWPGVANYLNVVADYAQRYRTRAVELPGTIRMTAHLGGADLFVRGSWLRVPVFPQVLSLYARQMATMAQHGDIPGTVRLSLLPPLASIARLAYKITGDPRGIW